MRAQAIHFGRAAEMTPEQLEEALAVGAAASALRALKRREDLHISPDAYWPTVQINISLDELQALLAAVPERRWPEKCRPLRREMQIAVREGHATMPANTPRRHR